MSLLRRAAGAITVATAAAAWCRPAGATETFNAFTLSSLANQNVNVMAANQRLLRAQQLVDFRGFYFGIAGRGAPAKYAMSDGSTLDGGVARVLLALGGRVPEVYPHLALFAGAQVDMATASSFPNVLAPAGGGEGKGDKVVGFFSEAILHGGLSYDGVTLGAGWFVQSMRYDADPAGRFVPYGYPDNTKRNFRAGTPALVRARQGEQQNTYSYFVNLDYDRGYSLGALFSEVERLSETGQSTVDRSLSALRALAQPQDLIGTVLPRKFGYPGIGLNRYGPGVDYYGDRFRALQQAVSQIAPLPPTRDTALYEVPLVWDRMLGSAFSTRVVPQVAPDVLFRLAELSASTRTGIFEAGARGMAFRRADAYTGAVDLYAAIHIVEEESGQGLLADASYSYNSPDSSTFLPLPNAHVVGFGLVLGLPEVMPPAVPIARDPLEERKRRSR